MNLNKELELKVEIVKKAAQQSGRKITQGEMATRLGKSRTYFSQLKKGHENVSPQFMAFFNDTFKEFLPKPEMITAADIAALKTSIDVFANEIAKLKKDVYKDKSAKDYLLELLQEIEINEVGKQVQKG